MHIAISSMPNINSNTKVSRGLDSGFGCHSQVWFLVLVGVCFVVGKFVITSAVVLRSMVAAVVTLKIGCVWCTV